MLYQLAISKFRVSSFLLGMKLGRTDKQNYDRQALNLEMAHVLIPRLSQIMVSSSFLSSSTTSYNTRMDGINGFPRKYQVVGPQT
jgi:hypothetical protein